jgi:hypothetical protein
MMLDFIELRTIVDVSDRIYGNECCTRDFEYE